MCGIAGAAGPGSAPPAVAAMTERLRHRGPDAGAVEAYGGCVLGHRRLAIIDLSADGNQPMPNEDGSVRVAYNGEIYNFAELRARLRAKGHTFRSRCDTEVLVHLYEERGADLVHELRGMFAFAIWDTRRDELLLARDRLGIKPLYYRVDGETLAFASEVRALARPGDRVDAASVAGLVRLGWVPSPRTILEPVRELPAGSLLRFAGGQARVTRWWEPPVGGPPPSREYLADVLADAVARHLVADVPVGLFLSAGLDSLAVATLAARARADVRAYTVAFDGGPDEAAEAAVWAARLGIRHDVVRIGGADVLAKLDDVIGALDQPSVDGVNSWVVSRAVRDAGIVVALSGLGGDEMFGGYSTFRHVPRLKSLGALGFLAPPVPGASRAARAAEAVHRGGWAAAYAGVRGLLPWASIQRLWPSVPTTDDRDLLRLVPAGNDTVTGLELANYLPDQLLRDTDAMSMAHSIEVRVPLLDDAVVTAALRLPGGTHSRKPLFAAAVSPDLVAVATAPKRTFTLPFDRWLRGDLAEGSHTALVSLGDELGFDRAALLDLWARFLGGGVNWRAIWCLTVLGRWLEERR